MPHHPDPTDNPQSADVILHFQIATYSHHQAQARMDQWHAHENELQGKLAATQRTAAEMLWNARASKALSVCEAERGAALAATLQAASAEAAKLELTTSDDIQQLEALEDAKMALAGKIGTAKTVALQQLLRELDATGLAPAAEQDIAAAHQVDRLYEFGTALRPEQMGNELLQELFAAHAEVQEMHLDLDCGFGRLFPDAPMLDVQAIDQQISECALETYECAELAYRRLADTTLRKAGLLASELAAARDNLRDAQADLTDKAVALSDATAALQQFMSMAAAALPPADALQTCDTDIASGSGRLAAIREDEQELILEALAEATTTGVATGETAPWMTQ